jgi:predicted MPP superfamily phosphohydrolase
MAIFVHILIFIALIYAYMKFETTWLKVERLNFSRTGVGLRIIHLTDLHVYMTGVSAKRIRNIVEAENPDVILLTGDYINTPLHCDDFLKYLSVICKGYRAILCLGNHDIRAFGSNTAGLESFISEIEALNVEVLRNRTVVIEKSGKKYNIIGIDDLRYGNPDIEKAMVGCVPGAQKIAITHNPDLALKIPGKIVDYMFAGHFHGGQIWMPFHLEFILLRDDQLCKMGIYRGLKRINDINVYMNRGTGNGVVKLRFLSRPEVLICTIP